MRLLSLRIGLYLEKKMKKCCCLILLLLCVPLAPAQRRARYFEDEYQEEYSAQFRQRWQEIFGLRVISDKVYFCLATVDPHPVKDFVSIRQEQLSRDFLTDSAEWMETVLRKEANPLLNKVKPSKYCPRTYIEDKKKAGKKGYPFPPRTSLVLYEWENDDFHFRLMQSDRGLLLQTRPKKRPFDSDKGVPAEQVAALLKCLINLEEAVPKGDSVERAFHLPKQVRRGVTFDNMPCKLTAENTVPEFSKLLPASVADSEVAKGHTLVVPSKFLSAKFFVDMTKWSSSIVGFLTADSLCVVIRSQHRLSAPREQERDLSIPDVDRNPAKFHRRWREMYGLRTLPDEVAVCLAYVDPLPDKDFAPFRQERLSKDFLRYEEEWMDKVFRKEANPYANKIKPSKYYLSKPGASDLLFYQWENRDFHLRLMESCRGMLLEAHPKKEAFDPAKGVPAEQVAALLKRLLNLDAVNNIFGEKQSAVPKGESVDQAFHLPKQVMRGVPFHNMPRHDSRYKPDDFRYKVDLENFARSEPLWPRCIVGFLSADALCVVIPNCDLILAFPGIGFDADWLRDALVGKDNETRLYKPLTPKPPSQEP
jgi:hypothetical protein